MRSKKALYNIGTNLLVQLIVILYGFIVPKIIIQLYGSNVNGLVLSITQFLGYITLLESGIGPVIKSTLYKPIAQKNQKDIANILRASEKFFRTIAAIFLVYLIILAFLYPFLVSNSFDYFFAFSLVIIISISTFAEYFFGMTYKLYLQAEQKNYVISLIQLFTYIACILVIIVLVHFSVSIQMLKLVSGLIFIARPICQNLYVKRKYNINLKEADVNYKLKNKWDGLAQHIASVIHNNTDITVLTLFGNLIYVSIYSVYNMVLKGIKSLIQAFTGGIDSSFGDMLAKKEYENLNKKFNVYEVLYYNVITVFYTCTLILILPFIKVYAFGITDANYIRPLFAFLIVMSEFTWALRCPYSSLTLAAGHFKQTQRGAWIEAFLNIIISVALVIKFGLVGVAVGTLVAMIYRTCEYIYYANKNILKRNVQNSIKKILSVGIETAIIICISKLITSNFVNSYVTWIIYALIIFLISIAIVLLFDIIFYRKEIVNFKNILKQVLGKKEKKHAKS